MHIWTIFILISTKNPTGIHRKFIRNLSKLWLVLQCKSLRLPRKCVSHTLHELHTLDTFWVKNPIWQCTQHLQFGSRNEWKLQHWAQFLCYFFSLTSNVNGWGAERNRSKKDGKFSTERNVWIETSCWI